MSSSPRHSRWLHTPRPVARPRRRLFCFPFAGGSATSFLHWPNGLPDDVEVVALAFPGRAARLEEAPLTRMEPLATALHEALRPLLDRPFAFFGHSMGALVAWEMAHVLSAAGDNVPEVLFVSGRRAPHVPGTTTLHTHDDDELLARLRRFYGTPQVLIDHPELMELVLPSLRADLELLETWSYMERPPLPIDLIAFGGSDDPGVAPAALAEWARHTSGSFDCSLLPGGHFFMETAADDLIARISRKLLTDKSTIDAHQRR